ncbi:ABC transporter ATP-binding protein [Deltaproteobacteria bacterium OttesenSCG-928-K17]|nr:ABC transporter ATP-binding protein [Deltaproteobacteria bacterium OttesenSCG-928-K17]
MGAAAVNISGLGHSYQGRPVFEGLNFHLSPGASLALVGPSGCGKSTFLHILAGLIKADQGRAEIDPAAEMSLVLQHYGLFPWKTARANIELPLALRGEGKSSRREKALKMLNDLGLGAFENSWPARMSGGQRQRLALGRALITEPDLLLLDEPFSSLDAITRESLQNLLARLWREHRPTLVLATHDIEEAVFFGERIMVMGGEPSAIKAELENPRCGREGARQTDEFFSLVKKARQALADPYKAKVLGQ